MIHATSSPVSHSIAIVHDWLDTWAGGEQCLEQMLAVFPHARLFALVDFLPPAYRARLGGRAAHTSFLQRIPGASKHFRRLLPLFPRAIESLDVAAFDVVISSSHAVAKGVRTDRRQLHLCYCYTPMRYAWDLRDQYLDQVGLSTGLRGSLVRRELDRIARWDRKASERVDHFIAISRHIAARIERCYGRASTVIYPPVNVASAVPTSASPRHDYVTVSRLVPYKRIDVIAAAFRLLPDRRLVVVGAGPELARIQRVAGPNVRFVGHLPDRERDASLGSARAFIFAADEDFGIAPLEAQAHGTPVIAYRAGGVAETVAGLDHASPTGVFFDRQTPESIAQAVRQFEAREQAITAAACRANALRFAAGRFRDEFAAFVAAQWASFEAGRR